MTTPVAFLRAASAEFDAAANWYRQRRAKLGEAFINSIQRVLDRVAAQPDFYPLVRDDVREAIVPRYPFCIYYRQEPDRIVVLSVFHTARDPSVWQLRA